MGIQLVLTFLEIVVVIVSVLQIILFFKIWKMTNDVADIKAFLKEAKSISIKQKEDKPCTVCGASETNSNQSGPKDNGFKWTDKASAGDRESYGDMEKLLNKGQCAIREEGNPSLKIVDMDSLCEIEGNYDVICIKD